MNKSGLLAEPQFDLPELYLTSGSRTEVTKQIRELANLAKGTTDEEIVRNLLVLMNLRTIGHSKNKELKKFERTSTEILESGERTGCCDSSTLFTALARARGIPAMQIITLNKEVASKSPNHVNEGHFYTAVFLKELGTNGEWKLINTDMNFLTPESVDIRKLDKDYRTISNIFYAFAYTRDYSEVGIGGMRIHSVESMNIIQTEVLRRMDEKDIGIELPKITLSEKHKAQRESERRNRLSNKYTLGIIREIAAGNTELLNFIEELEKQVSALSNERISKYLVQVNKCAEMIGQNVERREDIVKELQSKGITLSHPVTYNLEIGSFRNKNRKNCKSFDTFLEFNGCKLTKEMLTDNGLEELKKQYENMKKHNSSYDAEIEDIDEQIKKYTKKLKRVFSKKKAEEIKDEMLSLQERQSFLKACKRDENNTKINIEEIEKMTPETRKDVIRYIETSESLISAKKLIDSYKKEISNASFRKYSEEILNEAFDKIIEANGWTTDDILSVFQMFKAGEGRIVSNPLASSIITKRSFEIEKHKELIESFLKYIYEPEVAVDAQPYIKKRNKEKNELEEEEEHS